MKLSKDMILQALKRLGELAQEHNIEIELIAVGGIIMVLEFNTRSDTEDVDVLLLKPKEWKDVYYLATKIALENNFDAGWLNTAAKIFYKKPPVQKGKLLFSAPGIKVYRPVTAQTLVKKLSLTREDKAATDWDDAEELLRQLRKEYPDSNKLNIRQKLTPFVAQEDQTILELNFNKMWKELYNE